MSKSSSVYIFNSEPAIKRVFSAQLLSALQHTVQAIRVFLNLTENRKQRNKKCVMTGVVIDMSLT